MFWNLTDEEQIVRKILKLEDPKDFYRKKLMKNLKNPSIENQDLTRQLGQTTTMLVCAVAAAIRGETVCLVGANEHMDEDLMHMFKMMMNSVGNDWHKKIVLNRLTNRQMSSIKKFVDHTVMPQFGHRRILQYAKEGWM